MAAVSAEPQRPPFARAYPADADLDALVRAFVAGDFATVRRDAEPLALRTGDPAIAAAARDLRRRIDPDPLATWLIVASAGLLAFLTAWFFAHGR